MAIDWERHYRALAQLIEEMPTFEKVTPLPRATMEWLGRAQAHVQAINDGIDPISMKSAVSKLNSLYGHSDGAQEIRAIVHRAFAAAEFNSPPGMTGAFIPVGGAFDAFAQFSKIVANAQTSVMILDPYMDEILLRDFAVAIPERISIQLMADQFHLKPTLAPAVNRWQAQHGAARPLEARVAPERALHDRAIFVDGKEVWLVSQSFNAIAVRSHATMVRADDVVGAPKLAAYLGTWAGSRQL